METRVLPASAETIAKAARLIASGGIVAMPTETVYGLAADATNGRAVAAIYAAKRRPAFNPLIVHVLNLDEAEAVAALDPLSRALVDAFWPGPLTIVVPLRATSAIASLASAGLATIGLRAPAHPAMRALIEAAARPLAAPSANASNRLSPTRAEHVVSSLGGRIPLVVDGGACALGLESTIVQVAGDTVRLLRHGPIGAAALADITGIEPTFGSDGSIVAPGGLAQHYAPTKPLRLDATEARAGEWLIGYGAVTGDASLSPTGDPNEAAARLFDLLHAADAGTARSIAVAPIPEQGLGAAINDRLRRAAA